MTVHMPACEAARLRYEKRIPRSWNCDKCGGDGAIERHDACSGPYAEICPACVALGVCPVCGDPLDDEMRCAGCGWDTDKGRRVWECTCLDDEDEEAME